MMINPPTRPCPHCDGEGRVYGYFTINPSEREHYRTCDECDGRGWDFVEEDEHPADTPMLIGLGIALAIAIGLGLNDIMRGVL